MELLGRSDLAFFLNRQPNHKHTLLGMSDFES